MDRDGVVNELVYFPEMGIIDSPFTVDQFKLMPNIGEAIKRFREMGLKVIVVSNQPGMAKNHFSEETFEQICTKMNKELAMKGAFLDGEYYCFHHPEAVNLKYRAVCDCRKPKPGLLLRAAKDFNLDLHRSFMVGDGLIDVKAGKAAGCKTLLMGSFKCYVCRMMDRMGARPDYIVSDLFEAAEIIKEILNRE